MPNANLKLHHDYTNVKVLYAHEQSLEGDVEKWNQLTYYQSWVWEFSCNFKNFSHGYNTACSINKK